MAVRIILSAIASITSALVASASEAQFTNVELAELERLSASGAEALSDTALNLLAHRWAENGDVPGNPRRYRQLQEALTWWGGADPEGLMTLVKGDREAFIDRLARWIETAESETPEVFLHVAQLMEGREGLDVLERGRTRFPDDEALWLAWIDNPYWASRASNEERSRLITSIEAALATGKFDRPRTRMRMHFQLAEALKLHALVERIHARWSEGSGLDEALVQYRTALALHEAEIAVAAADPELFTEAARARLGLSRALRASGDRDGAEAELVRLLGYARRIGTAYPANAGVQGVVASILAEMGQSHVFANRREEARQLFLEARSGVDVWLQHTPCSAEAWSARSAIAWDLSQAPESIAGTFEHQDEALAAWITLRACYPLAERYRSLQIELLEHRIGRPQPYFRDPTLEDAVDHLARLRNEDFQDRSVSGDGLRPLARGLEIVRRGQEHLERFEDADATARQELMLWRDIAHSGEVNDLDRLADALNRAPLDKDTPEHALSRLREYALLRLQIFEIDSTSEAGVEGLRGAQFALTRFAMARFPNEWAPASEARFQVSRSDERALLSQALTFARLLQNQPNYDYDRWTRVARALADLGEFELEAGNRRTGFDLFDQAIAEVRNQTEAAATPEANLARAGLFREFAERLARYGETERARDLLEDARREYASRLAHNPGRRDLERALNEIGRSLGQLGDE